MFPIGACEKIHLCFLALLLISLLFGKCESKTTPKREHYLNPMKHPATLANREIFMKLVVPKRSTNIAMVCYYHGKETESQQFVDGLLFEVGKYLRGALYFGAVDCDVEESFCQEQKIGKYPTLMYYPLFPRPPFFETDLQEKTILNRLNEMVPHNVKILDDQNYNAFITGKPTFPKILYFGEDDHPSFVFKALSHQFDKIMLFGFVPYKEEHIRNRYNVVEIPRMVVVRRDTKDTVYDKEFKFQPMFDFLNIYAETFVSGGGFTKGSGSSIQDQPWKEQDVPELNKDSSSDICLKKGKKGLCVVYVKTDGTALTTPEETMIKELKQQYDSKLGGRGIIFRYMWMDLSVETEFKKFFFGSGETPVKTFVVVINPGSRLRTFAHEPYEEATEKSFISLMEKVSGGDARFKNVEGQKLPNFVSRSKAKEEL